MAEQKKRSTTEELMQEIEKLKSDVQSEHTDAVTFLRQKKLLEDDARVSANRIKELETKLARSESRYSRFSLMRIETWSNSAMRLIVIFTFAIVGPILLAANLLNFQVSSVLLDVFKIWLGAAIGISTNLLQKNGKPMVTLTPEEQATSKMVAEEKAEPNK